MALAGSQNGYTVTWGTVELNFVRDATGYVTLYYYDGTSASFVDADIYSLSGNTYNNVVSVYIFAERGEIPRVFGSIAGSFEDHEFSTEFVTNEWNGTKSFWSDSGCGTITLGADLEITWFFIETDD